MKHDKDYVYDAKGLLATASSTDPNTRRYFFQDHLGTTRVITNRHGITTGGYHSYYLYGDEIQNPRTTVGDRMAQYTGHEREAHGHADYMLGRHYSYREMRFLSVDPGSDGWNLYAYGAGNPLKFVDPDGQAAVAAVSLKAAGGAAAGGAAAGGASASFTAVALSVPGAIAFGTGVVAGLALGEVEVREKTVNERISDAFASAILSFSKRNQKKPEAKRNRDEKTGRKLSKDKIANQQDRVDGARSELNRLRSKPNKTPEDKAAIDKAEKAIKKAVVNLRKSEVHFRTGPTGRS